MGSLALIGTYVTGKTGNNLIHEVKKALNQQKMKEAKKKTNRKHFSERKKQSNNTVNKNSTLKEFFTKNPVNNFKRLVGLRFTR